MASARKEPKKKNGSGKKPSNGSKEKNGAKKSVGGRPTLLTEETMDMFTSAIAIGSPYALAARYARISENTVYHWMRLGRAEAARRDNGGQEDPTQEPFLRFLRAVEEAEADAGVSYQTIIDRAARVDPVWAWKMLRVRFPAGYMENDFTTNIDIPSDLPNEYLDRIIAGENPLHVLSDYERAAQSTRAGASPEAAKTED